MSWNSHRIGKAQKSQGGYEYVDFFIHIRKSGKSYFDESLNFQVHVV